MSRKWCGLKLSIQILKLRGIRPAVIRRKGVMFDEEKK